MEILYDKRRTLRVQLRTVGSLTTADGGCEAHLLNLSESGALVAVIEPHHMAAGEAIALTIPLPQGGQVVMDGHIAHVKDHMLGLDCTPVAEADENRLQQLIDALALAR